MTSPIVRRRALLTATLATTAAGCEFLSTDPEESGSREQGEATGAKQAPDLAELVEGGQLPQLEERLPDEPLVIEPVERAGQYGGEWHTALLGPSNGLYVEFLAGYDPLVRWSTQWTGAAGTDEIVPNIASRFEVSDDGTTFTFWLRPGMRWSDGEPFTADDVVFAINDVLLNEEITPAPPALLSTLDGDVATVEKLDDYQFRIVFPTPSGLFLPRMATLGGNGLTTKPAHYLRQFHAEHNPDIEEIVTSEGASDWVDLFQRYGGSVEGTPHNALWFNSDLPTLWAWKITEPVGEGDRAVMERNPYYWKTDPDGRQLPYLDRVVFDMIADEEVLLLRTSSGELNLEVGPDTRYTTPRNKPALAQDRDTGGYRFLNVQDTRMAVMHIMLNLTHKDPAKREVFTNKNFRIGLSHAIDRDEIIRVVLQRQGEPYQAAPLPESPFYDEEFATQFLEYDEATANDHLDRAGYSQRNADGFRLGPDGQPIVILVDFVAEFRPEWGDMLELVKRYWRAVGVDLRLRSIDRSLWDVRTSDNDHDAGVWHGGGGLDVLLNPVFFMPDRPASYFATPWGHWYASRGAEGEEPPPGPKRQMELYDQVRVTIDPEKQTELMNQIIGISREEFYSIGVAREVDKYFIASTDFHNIPEPMIINPSYPTPGPTSPEQYFLDVDDSD